MKRTLIYAAAFTLAMLSPPLSYPPLSFGNLYGKGEHLWGTPRGDGIAWLHTASIPAAYGKTMTDTRKLPYIGNTMQFPQGKARNFRHTFRLQIPQESSAISQLSIGVPAGLTVRNNITVTDQSGREINPNVSINGSQIILVFPEPVAPGTGLKINMNNVRRWGVSNAWLYHISAKFVGIGVEITLGVARFKVY